MFAFKNPIRAYLDCGPYKIPLEEVSYWGRGTFFIRNEFDVVNNQWQKFKHEYGIKSKYTAKPTVYTDQSNIIRHNNDLENIDVFYITCGDPIGTVPENVKDLFMKMARANVCAPIDVNDSRINLVEK